MDRDDTGRVTGDAPALPDAGENMADASPIAVFKAAMAGLRENRTDDFPPSLQQVTEAAGQSPTGRWMLDQLGKHEVSIREDSAYLDSMAPPGLRLMAAYDPPTKSIALRSGLDPEATAALLVHEGRHALQDASGALAFDRQPWRLSAGSFMAGIRAVEADAHALQAQFSYERYQAGQSAAWEFLRQNKPGTAKAFEASVHDDPANLGNGVAMKAAFDAFLADPAEIRNYTAMNLPQWVASLREAPSAGEVGRGTFDPQPLVGMAKAGPLDYQPLAPDSRIPTGLDPVADAELTKSGANLVALLRSNASRRAELLQQDDYRATLQMFRLSPQDLNHLAQTLPPPSQSRPTDRGR